MRVNGFTLAELLIALAILGEIATFTIPKIINAQQNGANIAKAKEVAGMIAGAYQQAQWAGIVTSNTKPADLTPYMNFISIDSSGTQVDSRPGQGANICNVTSPCITLHQGGTLWLRSAYFSGTSTSHSIQMVYDPDSVYSGSTADGPGKAVSFQLYYNGALKTRENVIDPSCESDTCPFSPIVGSDPSWFRW